MAWFWKKKEEGEDAPRKKVQIAEGLWVKCDSCKEIVYRAEVDRAGRVCPRCKYPFRISARERVAAILDADSFEERDAGLTSRDPLEFKDTKRYTDRVKSARKATGLEEAVITGMGRVGGLPVVLCVFEFGFLGAAWARWWARSSRAPSSSPSRSGRRSSSCRPRAARACRKAFSPSCRWPRPRRRSNRLAEERVPFISLLTDPTTGGVTASFAMLGDVILAEPRALIGFAGPRVIAETIRQPLPDGFQRSEFLLEHGQLDMVVERRDLRDTLRRILAFFGTGPVQPAP